MSRRCRPRFVRKASTIAGLVEEYEESQQPADKGWNPLRSLLAGYRELSDLNAAIDSAALAEDLVGKSYRKDKDGRIKRHGHQRRIKRVVLENAKQILTTRSNIEKLKVCKSFEAIIGLVFKNCSHISGIGALYIYDTSLRIGAFSKKLPKHVHLQAGAFSGARALGLDVKNCSLPVTDFPKALQQMASHEIEDFICIFKDQLAKVKI